MYAKLAEDGFYMQLYRAIRDTEITGYYLVALAFGQQREDLVFTRCQFGERAFFCRGNTVTLNNPRENLCKIRRNDSLAGDDIP